MTENGYKVTAYHLNLRPREKLEEAVNYIFSVTAQLKKERGLYTNERSNELIVKKNNGLFIV